jgi:hypothetical protein
VPAAGRDGQKVKMVESMKCDTRGEGVTEGRRCTAKSTFRWPRYAGAGAAATVRAVRSRGANTRRGEGRGEARYSEIYVPLAAHRRRRRGGHGPRGASNRPRRGARGEGRRGTAKSTFRWPRTASIGAAATVRALRPRGANNRRGEWRGEARYSEIYVPLAARRRVGAEATVRAPQTARRK